MGQAKAALASGWDHRVGAHARQCPCRRISMKSFSFSAPRQNPSAASFPVSRELKVVVNRPTNREWRVHCATGLSALDPRSDAALIILGDQPFLRPQTLDRIVDEYRRSGRRLSFPRIRATRQSCSPRPVGLFRSHGAGRGHRLPGHLSNHLEGIVKVEVEDTGILLDIDEPDDYDRLKARAREKLGALTNRPRTGESPHPCQASSPVSRIVLRRAAGPPFDSSRSRQSPPAWTRRGEDRQARSTVAIFSSAVPPARR